MAELSRKQREIQERDQLILDTASRILRAEGYAALSMEKIAKEIEYTRGTIYQHYRNKEEIVAAICIRNLSMMTCLFERASEFEGNSRERFLAVMCAYEFFVTNRPNEFRDFQIIKNESVRDKLCARTQEHFLTLETHVINCMADIIETAISNGELELQHCHPKELVFGLWAMAYGTMSLQLSDIPLEMLGISNPMQTTRTHAKQLLDGYGWKPLSTDYDYDRSEENIIKQIYKEGASLIKPAD